MSVTIPSSRTVECLEQRVLFAAGDVPAGDSFDSSAFVQKQEAIFAAIYDAMVVVSSGEISVVNVAEGFEVTVEQKPAKFAAEALDQLAMNGVGSPEKITEWTEIRVDDRLLMVLIRPPDHMVLPLSTRKMADTGFKLPSIPRGMESVNSSSVPQAAVSATTAMRSPFADDAVEMSDDETVISGFLH